jgi:YebC/PmpR family DNA-binding regulatory protein
MSGHSKWANIRVRKGAQDARKGKVYTKYARLIEIAAREGGADPTSNVRLRSLIDAAKAESVPNANIDRAIKKGSGDLKGDAMQEITYEAYGPGGSAFIIECLTDNKNRTLSNVKTTLDKNSGRFAGGGSVLWMFDRKGVVLAGGGDAGLGDKISDPAKLEMLELELIDQGADDFQTSDEHIQVVTDPTNWPKVRDFMKSKGFAIESAGLKFVPKQTVDVDGHTWLKIELLMSVLEEDEDVSEVHTNARAVA